MSFVFRSKGGGSTKTAEEKEKEIIKVLKYVWRQYIQSYSQSMNLFYEGEARGLEIALSIFDVSADKLRDIEQGVRDEIEQRGGKK